MQLTLLDMKRSACLSMLYFLFEATCTLVSSSGAEVTYNKSTLYFGVFISQESDFDFSGFIPPLELGVKTINDNSTVLKGLNEKNYSIEYEPITNGKVSSAYLILSP